MTIPSRDVCDSSSRYNLPRGLSKDDRQLDWAVPHPRSTRQLHERSSAVASAIGRSLRIVASALASAPNRGGRDSVHRWEYGAECPFRHSCWRPHYRSIWILGRRDRTQSRRSEGVRMVPTERRSSPRSLLGMAHRDGLPPMFGDRRLLETEADSQQEQTRPMQ